MMSDGKKSVQVSKPSAEPAGDHPSAHPQAADVKKAPAFDHPIEAPVDKPNMETQMSASRDERRDDKAALPAEAAAHEAAVAEKMATLTRRQMETFILCSNASARAMEEFASTALDYGQRSFRQASEALRSLSEARSPTEMLSLQSDFAQAFLQDAVDESARLSERLFKTFGTLMESGARQVNEGRAPERQAA